MGEGGADLSWHLPLAPPPPRVSERRNANKLTQVPRQTSLEPLPEFAAPFVLETFASRRPWCSAASRGLAVPGCAGVTLGRHPL